MKIRKLLLLAAILGFTINAQAATVSETCTPTAGVAMLGVLATTTVTTTSSTTSVTKIVLYVESSSGGVADPIFTSTDIPGNNPGSLSNGLSLSARTWLVYAWANGYHTIGTDTRAFWSAYSNTITINVSPAPTSPNPPIGPSLS